MPLPPLPTDSLYKFCALAGLALMVFYATYSEIKLTEINLQIIEGR